MPLLRGDHSDPPRAGFERTYEVEVVGTWLGESPNGTEHILVRFTCDEGHIDAYLYLTEKSWEHTAKKLAACSWDPKENNFELEELAAGEESPCKGTVCSITVVEEEYEGAIRPKVSWINPPGAIREVMEPKEAKSFASMVRKKLGLKQKGRRSQGRKSRDDRVRRAAGEGAARARGETAAPAGSGDEEFDEVPY